MIIGNLNFFIFNNYLILVIYQAAVSISNRYLFVIGMPKGCPDGGIIKKMPFKWI
jgi:hypothetical protein